MLLAIKDAVIQGRRVKFDFLRASTEPETEEINRIRIEVDASLDGTYVEYSTRPTEATIVFVRTVPQRSAWEKKLAEARATACPRDVMLD